MTKTSEKDRRPAGGTPERGALFAGEVLSGSEWILRAPGVWWPKGDYAVHPRDSSPITVLTGHWTAGEAGGLKKVGEHGPEVFRRMRARKSRNTGHPLQASVGFIIGAPEDPNDPGFAPVWQTMDPGIVSGVHVGKRWFNAKSIGVEIVSCGLPGRLDIRKRPTDRWELLGKERELSIFYPAQIRSWIRLANLLTGKCLPGNIEIPRQLPAIDGELLVDRRFTFAEAKRWSGISEHFLTPGTTKIDAGGLLLRALAGPGWELVEP